MGSYAKKVGNDKPIETFATQILKRYNEDDEDFDITDEEVEEHPKFYDIFQALGIDSKTR